jgi:ribonuclease P protein component
MLPAKYRLRRKADIELVFAKGKNTFDPLCGARVRKTNLPETRFAVVVGTKVSKLAVIRNRLRRRVREVIHHRLGDIATGYDIVLLVRSEAKTTSFFDLEAHVLTTLRKTGLLRKV